MVLNSFVYVKFARLWFVSQKDITTSLLMRSAVARVTANFAIEQTRDESIRLHHFVMVSKQSICTNFVSVILREMLWGIWLFHVLFLSLWNVLNSCVVELNFVVTFDHNSFKTELHSHSGHVECFHFQEIPFFSIFFTKRKNYVSLTFIILKLGLNCENGEPVLSEYLLL